MDKVVEMQKMGDDGWKKIYNELNMSIESKLPFEELKKDAPYRFFWVEQKAKGLSGKALDVGCGNGLLSHILQKQFQVTGVDLSPKILEVARRYTPEGTFVETSSELPFPSNEFELVTCLELVEHVDNLPKLIQELLRVTKEGGKLLITTPVLYHYDHPSHLRHFNFIDIVQMLEPYTNDFKICRIFKHSPDEGRNLFAVEVNK